MADPVPVSSLAGDPPAPSPQPPNPCWSAVAQRPPSIASGDTAAMRVFGSSESSNGISVAVLDANAIIRGGSSLAGCADKFVTVSEVLEEVRDPSSRYRLSVLPFPIEIVEPSPESIKKVVKFAQETGDLQTLSDVDLKLVAVTYTLECQVHGSSHLRDRPPPLQMVKVKGLHEAEMPGWGSNVPNLKEWEALNEMEGGVDQDSRILPLKEMSSSANTMSSSISEEQVDQNQVLGAKTRFFRPRKEIKVEGKNLEVGMDVSLGTDVDGDDDWLPAVSRSTHRRYLRRKARWESNKEAEENEVQSGEPATIIEDDDVLSDGALGCDNPDSCETHLEKHSFVQSTREKLMVDDEGNSMITASLEAMKLISDESDILQVEHIVPVEFTRSEHLMDEENLSDAVRESGALEISGEVEVNRGCSHADGGIDQKTMLHSLSESTVACITGDFAMQNIILQMGLRLLAPGGIQIRQLQRWVLRCHACNNVTQEIGRLFCPKCGNGGTLRKVSANVGENGIVLATRRPRVILRGTKFSLPLPHGGRDAVTKNLILREDQLPRKLLHPRTKKKASEEDEFFSMDSVFSRSGKGAPHKAPVRKAVAMFYRKRNPNDNHFSRRRC